MPPVDDGGHVEPADRRPAAAVPSDPALDQYRTAIRDATRLNRLFAILSEPAPLLTTLDRVLLALCELFAADVGAFLQPDGPDRLRVLGSIGIPEDPPVRPFAASGDGYAATIAGSTVPILVCAALEDRRMEPQLRDLGVECAAWIPVLGARDVVAILVLGRCQSIEFAASDADMLMAMAYRVGLVIERAAAEEERARIEARLRQAEKAESLSRMAAAIAHHFNNKLTGVMGHLELAMEDIAGGRDPLLELAQTRAATQQAATIGQLMLAYLGVSLHPRRPLDLVAVCDEVLSELSAALPPGITLRAELADRPVLARGSFADIRQVLANLVENAVEAMAGCGGEVSVRVREAEAAEVAAAPLISPVPASGGRYACIAVGDQGGGMDATILENAFDPFFSTKFTGRGLGLPVVLGLVRACDGAVAVRTAKDRGATVSVFLPLLDRAGQP